MNKVAAFALRRKNSILSMSEKLFCPPQPLRFWIPPACAGKRRSDWIIRSIYWDHPHVCGEKTKPVPAGGILMESPPRMRGKEIINDFRPLCTGITPAYAGKRQAVMDGIIKSGEKPTEPSNISSDQGLPPRMRGKGAMAAPHHRAGGITPAYAGKRPWLAAYCARCGDHPRVCGEKDHQSGPAAGSVGSPPRMRGKVWRRWYAIFHPPDHPRICGEKTSSPAARALR